MYKLTLNACFVSYCFFMFFVLFLLGFFGFQIKSLILWIDFEYILIFNLFIVFDFDFFFVINVIVLCILISFVTIYCCTFSSIFKFKIQNAKSKLRRKNPHATNPKNSSFRGKKNIQPIIYSVVWVLHVV